MSTGRDPACSVGHVVSMALAHGLEEEPLLSFQGCDFASNSCQLTSIAGLITSELTLESSMQMLDNTYT